MPIKVFVHFGGLYPRKSNQTEVLDSERVMGKYKIQILDIRGRWRHTINNLTQSRQVPDRCLIPSLKSLKHLSNLSHSCWSLIRLFIHLRLLWIESNPCLNPHLGSLRLFASSYVSPLANFNQCSSLSEAKAIIKKLSQAKWYQKYILDIWTWLRLSLP